MKLAAAMLSSSGADDGDCLQQVAQGAETLLNPEPGFFIIGKPLRKARESGGDLCTQSHGCLEPQRALCSFPMLRTVCNFVTFGASGCRHEIVRPRLKVFTQDRDWSSGNGPRPP
jgi:hypothetical protein